jgi:hypothetical protein
MIYKTNCINLNPLLVLVVIQYTYLPKCSLQLFSMKVDLQKSADKNSPLAFLV